MLPVDPMFPIARTRFPHHTKRWKVLQNAWPDSSCSQATPQATAKNNSGHEYVKSEVGNRTAAAMATMPEVAEQLQEY